MAILLPVANLVHLKLAQVSLHCTVGKSSGVGSGVTGAVQIHRRFLGFILEQGDQVCSNGAGASCLG